MFVKRYVGFDIGVSSVKVAYFSKVIGSVRCESLDIIPFKDLGTTDIEYAIREALIFEHLAKVMDSIDLRGRCLVVSLPGDVARVFTVKDVDKSPDGDYVDAVKEASKRFFGGIVPLGVDFAWEIIEEKRNKVDILGIVYSSEVVEKFKRFFDSYVQDFEIEPAPISLYNIFSLVNPEKSGRSKLLLHLGVRDVVMAMVSGEGDLIYGRTRSDLKAELVDEVTLENAGPYLFEVARAFKDFLSFIGGEFESLNDVEIYVSGGPTLSNVLLEAFKVILKLNVNQFNFLVNAPFKLYRGAPTFMAPRFTLAVGAVISRLL